MRPLLAPQPPPPVLRVQRLPGIVLHEPLEIHYGEMVAMQIASRAARDALVARLAWDQPTETGSITLLGRELARSPHRLLAGRPPAVCFVPRDGGLFANFNVWENIWTPVTYHRPDAAAGLVELVRAAFEELGLEAHRVAALRPEELSEPDRRLVAFVRAVALEPELVVIDSLFDDLDARDSARAARVFTVFHRCLPFRALLAVGGIFPVAAAHPRLRRVTDES